jgi:hypothetical protein
MVHELLFLELHADTLEAAHLLGVVELDAVRGNLAARGEAGAEVVDEMVVVGSVDFLDVQDELVHFERVVVQLAQFNLPGADVRGVVEDVLELVEVHERALDFVELDFLES